jgi:hypothetical protein
MHQIGQCDFRTISWSPDKLESSKELEHAAHIVFATQWWHAGHITRYASAEARSVRPENLRDCRLENIEIQQMISLFRYSREKRICFDLKVPDS